VDQVKCVTEGGVRFAEVGGQLKEVIVASATDVINVPIQGNCSIVAAWKYIKRSIMQVFELTEKKK
jgi:hypothetical protein